MPNDIHPLPDDVAAYVRLSLPSISSPTLTVGLQFVYPFTLETHVLSPPPPHVPHSALRAQIAAVRAARLDFLRRRAEEKACRRREALRKVAPGWEEGGDAVLQPKRLSALGMGPGGRTPPVPSATLPPSGTRDPMLDLVDGIASLDAARRGSAP
jgi:hypothetical protein